MAKKTLQVPGLEANQEYALQVRAIGDGEQEINSQWSSTLNFTTDTDVVAPNKVAGVTLVADGGDFVAKWAAVTLDAELNPIDDLKDYKVRFFETDSPGNFVEYVTTTEAYRLTFAENRNELAVAEDISVTVYARDTVNNASVASDTESVVNTAPSIFGAPVASLTSEGQGVEVQWDQPSGNGVSPFGDNADDIAYYEVYRRGVSPFVASVKIEDVAFTPGQHAYIDPDPGQGSFEYYVIAYDVYGNDITAADSNTISPIYPEAGTDSVAPKPVTNLSLTSETVQSKQGDEALIEGSFTAPIENTDASDYDDNEGFVVEYRVDGSGNPYEHRNIPDLRTSPTADTIEFRIENVKADTTYELRVYALDTSGNYSTAVSATETTPVDNTAPGKPAAPTAANDVQSVLVGHELGLDAGGSLPGDTVELIVYADTTTPLVANASNQLGVIPVVIGGADAVQKFSLPNAEATTDQANPATWYIGVTAIDGAGNESVLSDEVASTPDLIGGANIDNATINDAKINDLSANKLVADTAIANKLFVQDEIEVDTGGYLKSSDYDGSTTTGAGATDGWWLGEDGLTIAGGTVRAKALELSDDIVNLMPFEFTNFSNRAEYYQQNIQQDSSASSSSSLSTSATYYRYGFQSLEWTVDVPGNIGNNATIRLHDVASYNIQLEPQTDYVVSAYVKQVTGAATDIVLHLNLNEGELGVFERISVPNDTETRIFAKFNTSNATAGNIQFEIFPELNDPDTTGIIYIDGIQVERDRGKGEPSFFKVPGGTRITGDEITTGSIKSDEYVLNSNEGWALDVDGGAFFENIDIRTADSGARLELDTDGLRLYDTTGAEAVNLESLTGDATLRGDLVGGSIDIVDQAFELVEFDSDVYAPTGSGEANTTAYGHTQVNYGQTPSNLSFSTKESTGEFIIDASGDVPAGSVYRMDELTGKNKLNMQLLFNSGTSWGRVTLFGRAQDVAGNLKLILAEYNFGDTQSGDFVRIQRSVESSGSIVNESTLFYADNTDDDIEQLASNTDVEVALQFIEEKLIFSVIAPSWEKIVYIELLELTGGGEYGFSVHQDVISGAKTYDLEVDGRTTPDAGFEAGGNRTVINELTQFELDRTIFSDPAKKFGIVLEPFEPTSESTILGGGRVGVDVDGVLDLEAVDWKITRQYADFSSSFTYKLENALRIENSGPTIVRTLDNPASGDPIFQVRSEGEAIRLEVQHDGATVVDSLGFNSTFSSITILKDHAGGDAISINPDGGKAFAFSQSGDRVRMEFGEFNDWIEYDGGDERFAIIKGASEALVLGSQNDLHPGTSNDGQHRLGLSSARWQEVWAVDGSINTSDVTLKHGMAEPLGLDFVSRLEPMTFKRDEGSSGRPHQGFSAQQVKSVMDDLDVDFAGYIDPAYGEDDGPKGLRYHEFIGPLVAAIQELAAEVDNLKEQS